MKALKMVCTGLLLAGSLAFLPGCTDNDLNSGSQLPPPNFNNGSANAVNFTAGLTKGMRIVYSPPENKNGQLKTELKWEQGDVITIFSPVNGTRTPPTEGETHDANDQYGDYEAVNANGTPVEDGSVEAYFKYIDETGLGPIKWLDSEATQDFHAFYPNDYIHIAHDTVYGRMPEIQNTWSPQGLLYAKQTNVPHNSSQPIHFHFKQLLNRLDIHINKPEEMIIQAVRISSKTQALAGDMKAKITPDFDPAAPDAITISNTSNAVYYVVEELENEDDTNIDISVSLLPNNYTDLDITVIVDKGDYISQSVTRRISKTIEKGSRYIIDFGSIEESDLVMEDDHAIWMEAIPDDTFISELSIPGAIGAGTESKINWSSRRVQIYSVADLLLKGVRAFEFPRVHSSTLDPKLSIYDYAVGINSSSPKVYVPEQIQTIIRFLKSFPKETVVVLAYYGNSGWYTGKDVTLYDPARTVFCNSMRQALPAGSYTTYSKNLTMAECRGKILFLSPDAVFPGKAMGWDYYDNTGAYTPAGSSNTGKPEGVKDLKMLRDDNNSENLWMQRQAMLRNSNQTGEDEKVNAIKTFLRDAASKPQNTWVFNYLLAGSALDPYFPPYTPANFAHNHYDKLANYIINMSDDGGTEGIPPGPLGFIMMAYAGVKEHVFAGYPNTTLVPDTKTLNGDKLLNAVIQHNFRYLDLDD